ncbi:MAG TPA: TPM domain-containing protein [Acetivibrio clariflavus]|nr:TPM domain-containing protein [Acetivibrio clariflavus]
MLYLFKKLSFLILVFLLFFNLAVFTAYASNSINVVDDMGFLSDSDIQELQDRIDKIKDQFRLDVVIVITDKMNGKSSMAYADDYYDYNGYGIDSQYSGLLMLINMKDREVWISTTGRAIDIFTDGRISDMTDKVAPYLSKGNYSQACHKFLDDVFTYAYSGVPSGQYREERIPDFYQKNPTYWQKVSRLLRSWPVYVIPLIISIAATIIITYSSKGKVTITNKTYEESGSFVLTQNTDQFLRESVTRTRIDTESSGSGSSSHNRSSTHTSSSGRTHGGGGRSF